MAHTDPTSTPDAPSVPASFRTFVYFLALGVGFVGLLATGLVAIYWPAQAESTAQAVTVVNGALLFLTGALGVAYRPTR